MGRELLLDTGALVSILDRGQSRHSEFVDFYAAWDDAVVSTEAVLVESTHLLNRVPGGAVACIDFFLQGGATLVPASRGSLARCRELMVKYSDLPMDYADSTLVALAEELSITQVLTTDLRDFGVYRLRGGESFEILP